MRNKLLLTVLLLVVFIATTSTLCVAGKLGVTFSCIPPVGIYMPYVEVGYGKVSIKYSSEVNEYPFSHTERVSGLIDGRILVHLYLEDPEEGETYYFRGFGLESGPGEERKEIGHSSEAKLIISGGKAVYIKEFKIL